MNFFGKSNPGLRRPNNEDSFIVNHELGFCVLADGMGGAASGELASRIFVETAVKVFSREGNQSEQEIINSVQSSFRLANEKILSYANDNPEHEGMGCTAELLAFCNQKMVLGHVGDSRTYILREGSLKKITEDHSLVQDQINQGLITPSDAKKHSLRHVILRAVGIKDHLEVDIIRGNVLPGDLFLLCSDGLTDMVDDGLIREILSKSIDITQKAEKLIETANSFGGYDNITVILCEIPLFK
ncbi:MAG: Stp1/IreP family PP2C-type Ser/Thr phosphatase [bacterium]